ncbi:MAG: Tetratricopeptide repeat [Pseudomonadota bacterium]|jgi:Flp pilus assembly protein TadD
MLERLHALLLRRMNKLMGELGDTGNASAEFPFPLVDVAELRQQGNKLLAENQLEAAEARFREGLHHAPDDIPLLICLGYTLKEQGHLSEARIPLRRAVMDSRNPEIADAFYLLGQISAQQGDLEDAKRQYRSALVCKPDFELAHNDLMRINEIHGDKS